jgi:amino acid transporter
VLLETFIDFVHDQLSIVTKDPLVSGGILGQVELLAGVVVFAAVAVVTAVGAVVIAANVVVPGLVVLTVVLVAARQTIAMARFKESNRIAPRPNEKSRR